MNTAIHTPTTDAARLAESQAYCAQVAREQARNFYYGMKLVPQPKRDAMFALYTWMREADDLADESADLATKTRNLQEFRLTTHAAVAAEATDLPAHAMWPAVRDLVLRHEIPSEYLDDMIAGQLLDQEKTRYKTFEELYDYCYKVASVVGLCCIQIWGYEGSAETRKLAEWRGVAFQLTNILRDVMEDAERDRVYLPADEFDLFEMNPSMFTLGKPEELREHLRHMVERAGDYYQQSAPLDALVHADGRPCLWAMTAIYRGLLERMRADPLIVLRQRVRLSKWRKSFIALRAGLMRKGGGR